MHAYLCGAEYATTIPIMKWRIETLKMPIEGRKTTLQIIDSIRR